VAGLAELLRRLLLGARLVHGRGVEEVLVAQVEPQRQQVQQVDRKRQLVPLLPLVDRPEYGVKGTPPERPLHLLRLSSTVFR
jgi:hypothetical protein